MQAVARTGIEEAFVDEQSAHLVAAQSGEGAIERRPALLRGGKESGEGVLSMMRKPLSTPAFPFPGGTVPSGRPWTLRSVFVKTLP